MWPPWPHNSVIMYYTYKLSYFSLVLGGFIWLIASIFLFMGLTPSHVTQKPKYSISVCLKNDLWVLYLSPFPSSLLRVNSSFCTWSVQSPFVRIKSSYIHAQMNSNPWNKSLIFCLKMSDKLDTPVGRCLYQYFPHRRIIVHKLLKFLLSCIWQYLIFESNEVAYWKHPNFNNILLIFGIGYGFLFNCLLRFLKLLRKSTQFDLFLGWEKDGAPHYESFDTSRTPNSTKRSTSFLKISSCTFSTGYGNEHTGSVCSFNSKST